MILTVIYPAFVVLTFKVVSINLTFLPAHVTPMP